MLSFKILSALGQATVRFLIPILLLLSGVISACAQSDVDANTLLSLHFENSLNGDQGETPVQETGVTFESGISGQGVLVDGTDLLQYATAGNFNMPAGTIELWVKPRWGNFDNQHRVFFSVGFGGPNSDVVILKDGAPNFRFMITADDSEAYQGYSLANWNANQWHQIAVTWTVPGRMITYIDGTERINHASTSQDTLLSIPPALNIGSRSVQNNAQANCVIDELRISNIARTPAEIAARFLAAVTVQNLSINLVTKNLWKTWRIPVTLKADSNIGSINIPVSAVTLSSSDPRVLMITTDGKILGVGPGNAVLTATFKGVQATQSVNVRAPALEPRIQTVNSYLATPAEGALYEVPVVILRYLPTADGQNLDVSWSPDFYSLNPIPLVQLEQTLDLYDPIVKFMVEEGSRFRGYGSQASLPSLGYRVVAIISVYEPVPPGKPKAQAGLPLYDADWFQIFERFGMQDYVNNLGVKEVWAYWGGVQPNIPSYDPTIHPPENMREGWESNMSSPTTGDISNSNRDNSDLPIYDKTYIVYNRNIRRLDPVTIHGDGHQLEAMFAEVNRRQTGNSEFFWRKFVGFSVAGPWQRGRCGDTHHPPNALNDYDYQNFEPFDSDIMDWKPDGGQTTPFSAATYGNVPYRFPNNYLQAFGGSAIESNWYVFWRQSMPGHGNTIPYSSNRMTNWWQFIGDWDAANRAGIGLYEPANCTFSLPIKGQNFSPDGGTAVVNVTAGAACSWMASSNSPWVKVTSGDTSNNGNAVVSFSVAPNTHGYPRTATLVVADQPFVVTQAAPNPTLLSEQTSFAAIALDSVTFVRDPFSLRTMHNLSSDQRTRISLFALNVELLPSENISVISAQAEDAQHRIFSLPVEFVGKVPNFDWLTQINLRLPEDLPAGDLSVGISVRGLPSNKAMIRINPNPF
ncbi:MAG: hypothetical protein QOF62_1538 [Pyrinomonadaceae bacterium]|jgi:hypothetical protein|nr:hypothetical protein [Pyrinomonadaceae bacterium]